MTLLNCHILPSFVNAGFGSFPLAAGALISSPHSRALSIKTPTKGPPIYGTSHVYRQQDELKSEQVLTVLVPAEPRASLRMLRGSLAGPRSLPETYGVCLEVS